MFKAERQKAIMNKLVAERFAKISELMQELNASDSTIRRDIQELTLIYPLVTVRGRYGGGVKVEDWYHPGRKTLSPVQAQLLKKLATSLNGQDLKIMNSIFTDFSRY
mgnify:CR=1 FL=1